ncbi:MAG: autotransporter domain-containing protein [Phycisphaeraceae bacterium]
MTGADLTPDTDDDGDLRADDPDPGPPGGPASDSEIIATAEATSGARGMNIAPIGAALSDTRTSANATATGIDGGADDDAIVDTGPVTADATASNGAIDINANLTGAAKSNTKTTVDATSTGIAGGKGDDVLMDLGPVSANATATSGAVNANLTLAGAAIGETGGTITARATGVEGNKGDDTIVIDSTIDALADSQSTAAGTTYSLAGAGFQDANVSTDGTATGVDGGKGDDAITNNSTIDADAMADGAALALNVSMAGATFADASTNPDATATGIIGGAGDDTLDNDGLIDADATASASVAQVAFSWTGFTDSSVGDANTIAKATAVGMAGDAGDDTLRNHDRIDLDATARLTTGVNASVTVTGGARTSAVLAGDASVTGLDGGDGDDALHNFATIDVQANARAALSSGTSFSLAGAAADLSDVTATATANGLDGGAGANVMTSDGYIDVDALTHMDVDNNSVVIFGAAASDVKTNATATATGMLGGDMQDTVRNNARLDAFANAATDSDHASYVFVGSSSSAAVISGNSIATGIDTGDGADMILNETDGIIEVEATTNAQATGGAEATFGDADTTNGSVGSNGTATGIDSGAGDDQLHNLGTIEVLVTPYSSASNDSASGFLFGDAGAAAGARADVVGAGVALGDGDDTLLNLGTIDVSHEHATLVTPEVHSAVRASADSKSSHFTASSAARSTTNATLLTHLTGIDGGGGDDRITNTGTVDVGVGVRVLAMSNADGQGASGNAFGSANATVGPSEDPALVVGIDAHDGNNHIDMPGTLNVTATPETHATNVIDGDNTGVADGATAAVTRTSAFGVRANNGQNTIINDGDLTVNANPTARTNNKFSGGWAGDIEFTSTVSARASTVGIHLGDGHDTITNNGNLTVSARPTATMDSEIDEGAAGDVSAFANVSAIATVTGIDAGNGDNQIINTGEMNITADTHTVGTSGARNIASATAVRTGNGDDIIVNAGDGQINTTVHGATGAGDGIDTGEGDDLVRLLDTSSINSSITLGEGDDTIAFAGTATFDTITGGAGLDTVRLEDRETRSLAPSHIQSIERWEVNQGTVDYTGDVTIVHGGALRSELFNGTSGKLDVSGQVEIRTGSEITVVAKPQLYHDGDTFDVLVADDVSGEFEDETLPASRVLDAHLNYLSDGVQVEMEVTPFMEAARHNPVQSSVGSYLDRITPDATGDMAEVIGEFQQLSDQPDIDEAFASLSPDSYSGVTQVGTEFGREFGRLVQQRIGARRSPQGTQQPDSVARLAMADVSPQALGAALHASSPTLSPRAAGVWVHGMGQKGNQNASDGFTDVDFRSFGTALGLDHLLTDHLLVGVSMGYATTDLTLAHDRGDGEIESLAASLYGSWFSDEAWLDGSIGYGRQWYDNQRRVTVGTMQRIATSEHEGDLFTASLGGGLRIGLNDEWALKPFTSLYYAHLDEEGFSESGAGSANLVVSDRATETLISELGTRLVGTLQHGETRVSPFLGIAWVHDYEIDDGSVTSGFAEAPGATFTVDGADVSPDRARVEAGLGLSDRRVAVEVRYQGEFASDYESHGVLGSVGIRF